MKNIVIVISGGGSNLAALLRAAREQDWAGRHDARVAAVVSNRPEAGGLRLAREAGVPTAVIDHQAFASREAFDMALAEEVDRHAPVLVLLAGFMRVLTPGFVRRYTGRLLNIHPSLLPAFSGLHTHQRALDAGCRFAGATVHQVTEVLDDGAILDQVVVPVFAGDTADSLAARVLTQEHVMYPRVVARLLSEL